MYRTVTAAILKHQAQRVNGRLWFVDVDFETGKRITLAAGRTCILLRRPARAGRRARVRRRLHAQLGRGAGSASACCPEEIDAATMTAVSLTNALRPELADAAFNLWLLDGRDEWRAIARDHFLAMKRWNKARFGYADLADVTATPKRQSDHCPGYWWSEQMKYYYLMFANAPRVDYRRLYLTTEGNVLRGLKRK